MTCAVNLCGASHTCLESDCSHPPATPRFCSLAKGHTEVGWEVWGVLHNVWFSLGAYLLITAITMAALVCLFAGKMH